MSPPGRPRQFDTDQALDRVMEAFWTHGYASTSLSDLIEATGLQKGSIYKAFGDKHSLFLTALDRYLEKGLATTREILAADDPREAIRVWLYKSVGFCTESGGRKGCFAVNVVVELAPHDPEVATRLRRHLDRVEATVAQTVARGQQLGVIRKDRTPDDLASALNTTLMGTAVAGKCGPDNPRLEAVCSLALELLDPD